MHALLVPLRFYWFERGAWDPWVQVPVGGMLTCSTYSVDECGERHGPSCATGLAIGLGVGTGVFVSQRTRLTAALDGLGTLGLPSSSRGCPDGVGADARQTDGRNGQLRLVVGVAWGVPR